MAFRVLKANEENEATGGFAKDQFCQYWLACGYFRTYYYSWKKNYQLFSSITHNKLVLKRFSTNFASTETNERVRKAQMAVSGALEFGPPWFKKTWKEKPVPQRPPEEGNYDYRLILHCCDEFDAVGAKNFFDGYPYFIADSVDSDVEHDPFYWMTGIWQRLKNMNKRSTATFLISCGISHCCIRLLKLALVDERWLTRVKTNFFPITMLNTGSLILKAGVLKFLKCFWQKVYWMSWYLQCRGVAFFGTNGKVYSTHGFRK